MKQLTYESLRDMNPGDKIVAGHIPYFFVCRQELPDGEFCMLERYAPDGGELVIVRETETRILHKYAPKTGNRSKNTAVSLQDALDAGGDLAAAHIADRRPLELPCVDGILPEFDEHAYIPLGHPTVAAMLSADRMGRIWSQRRYNVRQNFGESILYDPRLFAPDAGAAKPQQWMLDGLYPVLINVHCTGQEVLESMYLTEVGDLRHDTAVWIRNVYISLPEGTVKRVEYLSIGSDPENMPSGTVPAERFYDCLMGLVRSCDDFLACGAQLELPDDHLQRSYGGTLLTIAGLFNGPQAHYGHRSYGTEDHNFFPPNYITAILAHTLSNQLERAGILSQYFLTFAIDPYGRIRYRQGNSQQYGFSASELGQLLWVIGRYHRAAGARSQVFYSMDRIRAMCSYLCSKIFPCEAVPGTVVVRTCAEADTNERIHDYLQNLAWSIRGLEAGIAMLGKNHPDTAHFAETATTLRESFVRICAETALDTALGKLVPFCLQYRVLPWTMAGCRETTVPVDARELEQYLSQPSSRSVEFRPGQQDFMENRYSNYRYYPELLSACLLTPEQEETIDALRANYGGELLGMIRFNRWVDDWPAYNMAIHYMERGLTDKFLLLLAAHARCHGLPDFHIYYEQVGFRNGCSYARADSSTPSILLNNIMLNFMFCYETVDGDRVDLLKAVPANWLGKRSFRADNLRCSFGTVSVRATPRRLTITRTGKFPATRLYLNGCNPDMPLPAGVTAEDGFLTIAPEVKRLTIAL